MKTSQIDNLIKIRLEGVDLDTHKVPKCIIKVIENKRLKQGYQTDNQYNNNILLKKMKIKEKCCKSYLKSKRCKNCIQTQMINLLTKGNNKINS